MHKGFLFLQVELLSDVDTLLNVVGYSPLQLRRQTIFITQLLESLEVSALLQILSPDVADQCTNPVDVVSQTHHCKYLYEDETECLFISGC